MKALQKRSVETIQKMDQHGATSMNAEAALAANILSIFDLDQILLD